ncbi:MAG: hypothetical protein PVI03_00375 [Candidatus Thorarchaeota archaeon]
MKTIEQKAYREYMQDGITEINVGFLLIIVGLWVIPPSAGFTLFLIWLALMLPITERVRQRYTYPRVGYVKLQEKDTWGILKGTLLFVAAIYVVMAAIVAVFHEEIVTSLLWWKWSPLIASMLLVGPSLHLQKKTGQLRYYAYGTLALLSGLVMSMIELPGLQDAFFLYMVGWGVVFLAIGFLTFADFISKHPPLELEKDVQTE